MEVVEVVEVKRTMVLGFESERMNEVEVKVAKIVCTKGHKVIGVLNISGAPFLAQKWK